MRLTFLFFLINCEEDKQQAAAFISYSGPSTFFKTENPARVADVKT